MKCLAAFTGQFTSFGSYVPYINISDMEDGTFQITVRQEGPYPAPEAFISLTKGQLEGLLFKAIIELPRGLDELA